MKGSKNAKSVGGTFSGALYNIEIPNSRKVRRFFVIYLTLPSFIKGIVKSIASFLTVVTVRSAMARSALGGYNLNCHY